MTRPRVETAPRLAIAADPDRHGEEQLRFEIAAIARARGVRLEPLSLADAVLAPVGAIAYAPSQPPDPSRVLELAKLCLAAAEARRPIVMCAAFERARGRAAEERALALAWLRSHGAVIVTDPDAWFETAILLAAYGPPPGPRTAVIAPPGGWLALSSVALALEEEARGGTRIPQLADAEPTPTVDLALCDAHLGDPPRPVDARIMMIPVVARAEHLPDTGPPALVGLRAALAAAAAAGAYGARLAQGLGPAPAADARRLRPDKDKLEKSLRDAAGERLGDHETKLLLAAYGVPVVRQGVATTPSAATRIAGVCGWPVEVKPWDPATAMERDGGSLATGLRNPPDVRRAFASVATAAGLPVGVAVIVRVTPPVGREVAVRIERHATLGWVLTADLPGARQPVAALAPLRRIDADELAAALESSRAADAPPDRAAFAELLVRASFAVVDRENDLESLDLGRIVVAPKGGGAVVVDARARLKKRRPDR